MTTTAAASAPEVRHVALSKLKASPANVRKTGAEAGLEELVASIAAHGLLQMPVVTPERDSDGNETGRYLVIAGERRRKALRVLADQKRIKKTEPVPCLVRLDGDGSELSLAENVVRAPMHPADQFEAFDKLRSTGLGTEDIAARFGVTPAVVKQRLRLAAVSPRLMDAYRSGEATLDQLMAFAITDDHARQEEVWSQLAWNKNPEMIRRLLTQSHVSARDRRAVFVGTQAYEAAGGSILRDLFAEDHGGYFTDSQLLDRLVLERLEAAAEELIQERWKWVEIYTEYPYSYVSTMRRIYPEAVALDADEQARAATLSAEYEALAAEHRADAPEEVVQKLDDLAEQIGALEQKEVYRSEDVARAGAIVALGQAGELRIERGFVRSQDEAKEAPAASGAADGADREEKSEEVATTEEAEPNDLRPLPDALLQDLTAHRTAALQECLAGRPDIALAAVVHALALRIFYRPGFDLDTCVGIELKLASLHAASPGIDESRAGQAIAHRHEKWARELPKESAELWERIVAADADTRLALLAYCVARAVDAVSRRLEGRHRGLRHAEELGQALALDMAQWWQPTKENYLGRVSKAHILKAVREGVSEEAAGTIGGMKKDAMAEQAERLLADVRWLPEVLRDRSATTNGTAA